MKKAVFLTCGLLLVLGIGFGIYINSRGIRVSVVGDVLLDRGVRKSIEMNSSAYPYEKISKILNSDDITMANLECPITEQGTPAIKKRSIVFMGDPSNIGFLKKAGFDIFDLANNHSMDQGSIGLSNTMKLLKSGGLDYFGAGKNEREAEKPLYIKKHGTVIGFLGFSEFPPEGYFSIDGKPDIAYLDNSSMRGLVKQAKAHCNILIVMFHWGREFDVYPTQYQQNIARMACDSGADIIIGAHPHVLQGIEKYKGKYIFYSLGNFIFDKQLPPHTDESGILQFKVKHNKIYDITFLPIKIINCQPTPAPFKSEASKAIYNNLKQYSSEFKMNIKFKAGKMVFN